MHYSVYGRTATEIIYERADEDNDFVGPPTWTEVNTLNLIVNLYLDSSELQAEGYTPIYMMESLESVTTQW